MSTLWEGRESVVRNLSEVDREIAETVSDWLENVVSQPHPGLGRAGPVCPFVLPALRADALSVLIHDWHGPHDVTGMVSLIDDITRRYRESEPISPNRKLHAMVVVIAGLPENHFDLVDEGHRAAKGSVIEQGYMLGQFHPRCQEPAARNPLFPVNRAPYPLYAIRQMAVHDILFLHHERRWFERYRRAYGHHYTGTTRVDRFLRDLYGAAARRYGYTEGEGE
ncbi:DUF6875 domain-containing protein [Nocardia sp. CA-135953]|uniref:DUF6875 domain-containing protein n=1 Tax=Nocardia sp. CA-135953 TaxID=3239978 RepID=UPI003D969DD1